METHHKHTLKPLAHNCSPHRKTGLEHTHFSLWVQAKCPQTVNAVIFSYYYGDIQFLKNATHTHTHQGGSCEALEQVQKLPPIFKVREHVLNGCLPRLEHTTYELLKSIKTHNLHTYKLRQSAHLAPLLE